MPDLRLALLQAPSPAGDCGAAFMAVEQALRAAGAAGADVLVVPESFAPGYNCDAIAELALLHGGAWQDRLALSCDETQCRLVFGYAERDGDAVFNAALALGPDGAELAHYRKIQLYGPREAAIYRAGDAYVTFDLAGQTLRARKSKGGSAQSKPTDKITTRPKVKFCLPCTPDPVSTRSSWQAARPHVRRRRAKPQHKPS